MKFKTIYTISFKDDENEYTFNECDALVNKINTVIKEKKYDIDFTNRSKIKNYLYTSHHPFFIEYIKSTPPREFFKEIYETKFKEPITKAHRTTVMKRLYLLYNEYVYDCPKYFQINID